MVIEIILVIVVVVVLMVVIAVTVVISVAVVIPVVVVVVAPFVVPGRRRAETNVQLVCLYITEYIEPELEIEIESSGVIRVVWNCLTTVI